MPGYVVDHDFDLHGIREAHGIEEEWLNPPLQEPGPDPRDDDAPSPREEDS